MQKSFFSFLIGLFVFAGVFGLTFSISPLEVNAFCAKQVVDPFQLVLKCKDKKKSKPAPKPAVVANGASGINKATPVKILSGYCYPENINEVIGSPVMWRVVTADSQGINVGGSVQNSNNRSYLSYPGYFYEWKGTGTNGLGTGVNAFHVVQNMPYVTLAYNSLGKKAMSVKVSYAGSSINITCTPANISGPITGSARVVGSVTGGEQASFNNYAVPERQIVTQDDASFYVNSSANYSSGVYNNSKDIERAMRSVSSSNFSSKNNSSIFGVSDPMSSSAQTAAAIFSLNNVPWIIVLIICAFILFGLIMYIMMSKK